MHLIYYGRWWLTLRAIAQGQLKGGDDKACHAAYIVNVQGVTNCKGKKDELPPTYNALAMQKRFGALCDCEATSLIGTKYASPCV